MIRQATTPMQKVITGSRLSFPVQQHWNFRFETGLVRHGCCGEVAPLQPYKIINVCCHQAGSTMRCARGAITSSCRPGWTQKLPESTPTCQLLWPLAWLPPAASCWRFLPGPHQMTARPHTQPRHLSLTRRHTCCTGSSMPMDSGTSCASMAWREDLLHLQAHSHLSRS